MHDGRAGHAEGATRGAEAPRRRVVVDVPAVANGVITVVSSSGDLYTRVRAVVGDAGSFAGVADWDVHHRETLAIAVLGLDVDPPPVDGDHVHVLLVDVELLADWEDVSGLVAVAPRSEVVLVVPDASWAARTRSLEVGAADVIQRDAVTDGPVLVALLGAVLERAVLRRERDAALARAVHEAELRHMLSVPDPTPVSRSMLGGGGRLAQRSPGFWRRVVEDYRLTLQLSLEQLHFHVDGDPGLQLRSLADLLCWADAGPSDVVELHQAVVSALLAGVPPAERETLIGELRLRLLELMGALVQAYRLQSVNRPADG